MKQPTLIGLFGIIMTTTACDKPTTVVADAQTPAALSAPQVSAAPVAISVDASGYHPDSVHSPAGKPVRLVFTRTTDEGCGQQVVFPTLGIRKDLPLNQPMDVDITMPASGNVAFTCGMSMYRGSVVVQ